MVSMTLFLIVAATYSLPVFAEVTCNDFYTISYNATKLNEKPDLVSDCDRNSITENAEDIKPQIHGFNERPLKIYAPDHVKKQVEFWGMHCMADIFSIKSRANEADVILLRSTSLPRTVTDIVRNSHQIWVMQFLESPPNTPSLDFFNQKINYTAGYRSDADIVTRYGTFERLSTSLMLAKTPMPRKSAALWIVSNCWTSNSRKQLAEQLRHFYKVDIFGQCSGEKQPQKFIDELFASRNYKYYLSFENSNCREYITEKVFENAFKKGLIPIVYGANRSDYEKLLPPNSFIFAQDYGSAEHLANQLKRIDANDTIYAAFFAWKAHYNPRDQNIFEHLCNMYLNAPAKIYHKLSSWWTNLDTCKTVTPANLWKETTLK